MCFCFFLGKFWGDKRGAAMVVAEPRRKRMPTTRRIRKQLPGHARREKRTGARCPPSAAFVGKPLAYWVANDLPVKAAASSVPAKRMKPMREILQRKTATELRADETVALDVLGAATEAASAQLQMQMCESERRC